MKQPDMIVYNLNDRGRKYRGKERNFNIKRLFDSINGNATQERVKTRAMLGYYGHKPRVLFGMEPMESGVVGGKYNEIEPAIVTTHLKAYMDGTIEHKTEFLTSKSGAKAAKMFSNRIGGFSSAIDEDKGLMYGFDYVLDPNFSTNRGFALDSANMTLDEVKAVIQNEDDEFWFKLLSHKENQIKSLALSLDNAQADNEDLLSILAVGSDVITPSSLPFTVKSTGTNDLVNAVNVFDSTSKLPKIIHPSERISEGEEVDYKQYLELMGLG